MKKDELTVLHDGLTRASMVCSISSKRLSFTDPIYYVVDLERAILHAATAVIARWLRIEQGGSA